MYPFIDSFTYLSASVGPTVSLYLIIYPDLIRGHLWRDADVAWRNKTPPSPSLRTHRSTAARLQWDRNGHFALQVEFSEVEDFLSQQFILFFHFADAVEAEAHRIGPDAL